jgi:putative SOS response-associated peptidase YedK
VSPTAAPPRSQARCPPAASALLPTPGDRSFAFAGLWEHWQGPDGPVESCAILTTEANEMVRPVHDRMPVILPQLHWAAWLDRGAQDAAALVPLLRPFPADAMRAYPVGMTVSNPRNDVPECLAPAP